MVAFNITAYGAEPGFAGCQAGAVQRAVDAAHASGGGRVIVPAGSRFVVGTIDLKSGVELHLERDAVLAGSVDRADYREERVAGEYGAGMSGFLIRARDAQNIAITGQGVIDQQGRSFADGFRTDDGPYALRWKDWRPRMLGLYGCRGVRVSGVVLKDPANWCLHLMGCSAIDLEGVTIRTPLDGPNCDGIVLDHCVGARVARCDIESGDDSIVLKTTKEGQALGYDGTRDIEVRDCRLMSTSSAIKIGSESQCDLTDLRFSQCSVESSARGLAIQLRDRGDVRDVVFEDMQVETRLFHEQWWGKGEPIYITVVPRQAGGRVGRVSRVRFERVQARSEGGAFIAASEPGGVRDLTFRDVRLRLDKWTKWPGGWRDFRPCGGEQSGLSSSTTSAIYLEGVEQAVLDGVRVEWGDRLPDYYRHALEVSESSGINDQRFEGAAARPGLPTRVFAPESEGR